MNLLSFFGLEGMFGADLGSGLQPQAAYDDGGRVFRGLDDPDLEEYIRADQNGSGSKQALFNTAVFRAVDVTSAVIAALPFRPMQTRPDGEIIEAIDHPLFEILNDQPNHFQTAPEFKQWMQMRALVDGDGLARIVKTGSGRISGLLPLDDVTATLEGGSPVYRGPRSTIPADEIFHLRGLSWNGLNGLSRIRQAARAINLAKDAEDAAVNIFRNNMAAGGVLSHPGKLSDDARGKLRKRMENRTGIANAGKWLVLQEGMTATPWQQSGRESQQIERSKHQVEEVSRVFGVPRPLMMMDDTSWGSGIEQLGIFFVTYALMPWFTAWEKRGRMSLLTPKDRKTIHLDFDESELLRGSMKDQAEFFSKAIGGPGTKGWKTANEIRRLTGDGRHKDGDTLATGQGNLNVPPKTPSS
ncbi:phage portal protein [Asticcacaulis excentricus]|uniref:Phage portal protein, HK97 family n=1 Tax=Asticcacaulis excentricus (strain ATCC 15261 / DSM 4724 / KCTC 12464 / NCIMB 9791 / VKM B-1370 / CB 48) TaxID=573065 RepID=E8RPQ0_ASTEC|nr:phage portal protein [Asticcacaulis excentricus]ADU12027.1 phage portal protein, HK97 family [Asticcacaulis excentricus CB 48]